MADPAKLGHVDKEDQQVNKVLEVREDNQELLEQTELQEKEVHLDPLDLTEGRDLQDHQERLENKAREVNLVQLANADYREKEVNSKEKQCFIPSCIVVLNLYEIYLHYSKMVGT